MGRTSRVLRATLLVIYCTVLVTGELNLRTLEHDEVTSRRLQQVDLASVASGLISGLQQGAGQVLSTQSQNIGSAVSDAAKVATDAASQQQKAVKTVTSALGGLVPGAQGPGSQGRSPALQLLQVLQQVTGQAPASDLQSSAIQALRAALNANLLPGPVQGQALSQALQRAFPSSPVGAPLPAAVNLRQPAVGVPLPSLMKALPRLSMAPSPLPSLDPLLGNAFPALGQSPAAPPSDAVEKENPELANPPPEEFAAIYVAPLEASAGLAPDTADAALGAPALDREQSGNMMFGPAPAPGPMMMMPPVPAPMFAPAPAPQQNINVSYSFNISSAAQQALSFAASFNLTTLSGTPFAVAINDTQQFLQDIQLLADPAANANNYLQVLTSGRDIFEHSCAKEKVELPKLVKPYCTGKSMQLSLVPWSCVLDDDTALLSCTPAYLTFDKYPDSCTLLNFSEGTIAGKECGLVKPFGLPETEIFGGRKFELKVLEALISLEKAAGGAVDGPLATIALAAAPLQDMPSSITSAVTTFLGG